MLELLALPASIHLWNDNRSFLPLGEECLIIWGGHAEALQAVFDYSGDRASTAAALPPNWEVQM